MPKIVFTFEASTKVLRDIEEDKADNNQVRRNPYPSISCTDIEACRVQEIAVNVLTSDSISGR